MNRANLIGMRHSIPLVLIFLVACTNPVRQGTGPADPGVAEAIEQAFPFDAGAPIDVVYQCARADSVLGWIFDLQANGTLTVAFTTDTSEDFAFNGTYTYDGTTLRLQMPGGPTMPFPLGLDEESTVLFPHFGIVAGFATPNMTCVAGGHRMNAGEFADTQGYRCPTIRIQAATDEENSVEFVHRAVPFSVPVPGSSFRQRDVWVAGASQPNVTRGYGIYRRAGERFYMSFRVGAEFAQAAGNLPVPLRAAPTFADSDLLTGNLNGAAIEVDQLMPEAGPCTRR